jgi:hypothetical protein
MNIQTKFSVGDKVFRIERDTVTTTIKCGVCNDTKQIEIKDEKFICPKCARGSSRWQERWYVFNEKTTIGKITVEVVLKTQHSYNYFDEDEIETDTTVTKETYMLAATGIGSGTCWPHSLLFLTLEEAQKEVDKLNEIIIKKENELV